MSELWAAMAIAIIFEGMMPFISPKSWRETILKMARLPDHKIRIIGITAMIVGLILLTLSR